MDNYDKFLIGLGIVSFIVVYGVLWYYNNRCKKCNVKLKYLGCYVGPDKRESYYYCPKCNGTVTIHGK